MTRDGPVHAGFHDELRDGLVEKAKAMRPLLERSAAEHERRGELLAEVVDALDDAEFFKMSAPRRWGGLCVSATTMLDVTVELAKGCPSTAWVVSIVTNNVWSVSTMSRAMQELVFRDGVPRICGPQAGMGKIERRGDRFSVSGAWAYGSASHHSSWSFMPALSPEGAKCFVAVPMTQLSIRPTWDVAGMKGTGSDTVVADNVVIGPAQITDVALNGSPHTPRGFEREPTDFWLLFPLLRCKAMSVVLGCAEGLLETVLSSADRAVPYSSYEHRKDSTVWQAGVGEAAAMIGVAGAVIQKQHALVDDAARRGHVLTYAERANLRGEAAVAAKLLIDAVEKLMNLLGSSAYMSQNPAQRYWRDFSFGIRHIVFNTELGYEVYGRQLLGGEPTAVLPDLV